MKTNELKASNVTRVEKWFRRPRRRHNPMLVFNMAVFNSARIRESIFHAFLQRRNVCL